jgi:UDPglucose 6-dehydrogenase
MQIAIIGTGYVGLVTGTCLADFGLQVTCIDQDEQKINMLNSGGVPIYEPNLAPLIEKNILAGRLTFTTDLEKAVKESKVIFIAVGTPSNRDGSANLKQIETVAQQIARHLNEYKVIVNKSTVPIGTAAKIRHIIEEHQSKTDKNTPDSVITRSDPSSVIARSEATKQSYPSSVIPVSSSVIPAKAGIHPSSPSPLRGDSSSFPSPLRGEGRVRVKYPFDIISNPEFLREGSAVYDFTHPDKIVIGTTSDKALKIMQEIYRPLYLIDTPFVITNPETAELIKYACNTFLATKITFINEIANLCDKVGADVHQIAKAMGLDGRISPKFLHPGPGFGGSCFPKDTEALCSIATSYGYEFKTLQAVISANKRQRELMVEKIKYLLGSLKDKTIGVLGLAFKQNTDDIRQSPSIEIIQLLLKEGAQIRCFDPLAMENSRRILPDLTYCQDEYETAEHCDALVIATEWNQFRNIDLLKIKKLLEFPILLDLRNLYEPAQIKALGFIYEGVGRK